MLSIGITLFNGFLTLAQILSIHSLFLFSQSSTTAFKFNVILLFPQRYLTSNFTRLVAMAFSFQKSCSTGDSNGYAVELVNEFQKFICFCILIY